MRNPGYVHELAAIELDGGDIRDVAKRNGVAPADLDEAIQALTPLSADDRNRRIHEIYVADAVENGWVVGDPSTETSWVLGQRAHAHYDLS